MLLQGDAKRRLTLALFWKIDRGRRWGGRWVVITLLEGSSFILFKANGNKCDRSSLLSDVPFQEFWIIRKGETREEGSSPLENPQGFTGAVGFCQPLPQSTTWPEKGRRTGHPRERSYWSNPLGLGPEPPVAPQHWVWAETLTVGHHRQRHMRLVLTIALSSPLPLRSAVVSQLFLPIGKVLPIFAAPANLIYPRISKFKTWKCV